MAFVLDAHRVRSATKDQLRDYYNEVLKEGSVETITHQLLHAVEFGSITPTSFRPWLGVSKSPIAIKAGLQQNVSVFVRTAAIDQLYRELCSSRWRDVWDHLGGTAGVLEIFSDLSVNDIRAACRAIGCCGKGENLEEKRRYFTELFMGLQPQTFPDAAYKTKDRRPLANYYRHLLPSCTEDLVERCIKGDPKGTWKPIANVYLLRYHPSLARREQCEALVGDGEISTDLLKSLVNRYPSANGSETGFSASMEFGLKVLRIVAGSDSSPLGDGFCVNDLARPLLRRAVRKKAKWSAVQEIVDLTIQYLDKHPSAGKEMTSTDGDIVHMVAFCWSREPQLFEKQLISLCSHPEYGTISREDIDEWEDFVNEIPPEQRYAVLKFCFRHSTGLDLESDEDLRICKGSLTTDLLRRLPAKEALNLFSRRRAARGDGGLVTHGLGRNILDIKPIDEGKGIDPDLYHVHLLRRNGQREEAEQIAARCIEVRKKKVTTASQPEQRAVHAMAIACYAVVSGSLRMHEAVVNWSKRFLRDPLVLRELQARYPDQELAQLLSGIPQPMTDHVDIASIRQRVEHANSIISGMFDTACTALGEPSFEQHNWHGTLALFHLVVKKRIDMSRKLKKSLQASDEDMYAILWDDTVKTILAIEEKANKKEYAGLQANTMRGILGNRQRSDTTLVDMERSTCRFLEDLAKARDELWRRIRSTVSPASTSLPALLPRGLPIQHLTTPFNFDLHDLEESLPYVASRVDATLFPDPTEALQPMSSEEDTAKAIGPFVDSYEYALHLYVPECCNKVEKEKRIEKVWNYAVGPLSQGRMTNVEAHRFWYNRGLDEFTFQNFNENAGRDYVIWPKIPSTEDPTKPVLWNPFDGKPTCKTRQLETTYLDLSLSVQSHNADMRAKFADTVQMKVPAGGNDESSIFFYMGEAGIFAALMYLEALYAPQSNRMMRESFPSAKDVRFPAIRIDDDFVKSEHLNQFTAARGVRQHLYVNFPPNLLHRYACNITDALQASHKDGKGPEAGLLEAAVLSVVYLGQCDRPAWAQDLAVRTIVDRPEASSWHRQLLKPSFLRRLSASDAQACYKAFANAVFEKIKAKEERQEKTTKRIEQTQEKQSADEPFVKVTTVKFLTQLLQDTEFIGEDTALWVLSELLKKRTHVDVQSNVVKSLLGLLDTSSQDGVQQILSGLESVIPLAGNINERIYVSEEDWIDAEKTGTLPEIANALETPMMTELIGHYRQEPKDPAQLRSFIDRILLPTLAHTKQQATRWVTLFLRKHNLKVVESDIPTLTREATYFYRLSTAPKHGLSYLPRDVLEDYIKGITYRIAPPPHIAALNKKLSSDPSLSSQPDVKAWLQLCSELDVVQTTSTTNLLSHLDIATKIPESVGITAQVIRDQYLHVFKTALRADALLYKNKTEIFLAPLLKGTYLPKPWWRTHGIPVVSEMINYVNSLRTPGWRRYPNRHTALLPNTFPWRLLLLDYPWPHDNESAKERDSRCRLFATQLSALLQEMRGTVYHNNFTRLKAYLSLDTISTSKDRWVEKKVGKWTTLVEERDTAHDALMNNRLLSTVYLGAINDSSGSSPDAEWLNVDIAAYMMDSVGEADWEDGVVEKDIHERLKAMVNGWKENRNEEVRRVGWESERRFFTEGGRPLDC
jgi:hypothetical protein